MKNCFMSLLLSLVVITGFSQNSKFEYTGRNTPAINKTKLNEARSVYEIMPEFSRYFILPYNEHAEFDRQVVPLYPQAYYYPGENYNYLFSDISVEISVISGGKLMTSAGKGEVLSPEQKHILNLADLGTDIRMKIKFKYRNPANRKSSAVNDIKEGEYSVTVIPQTEAQYPGGFRQFTEYLTQNVFNRIPGPQASEKISQAVLRFTVDEEGLIVDARIAKTSTDPGIDELLLDATNKMPKWVPAQNSKGVKVKQEFSIPLGGGGC